MRTGKVLYLPQKSRLPDPKPILDPLGRPGSLFGHHQPPQEPLAIIDPSTLERIEPRPREWVVDGWLPIGAVTICYADGGIGKTLLAQQLMTACAVGGSWCGMKVMRCRSIGLFCEDDETELHFRQRRINDATGTSFSDLKNVRWMSGVGEDNLLMTFDRAGVGTVTDRFNQLSRVAASVGPRLIVIDTAADTFGGNENDRGQVRQFVGKALTRLARETNAALLLNAHPSRAGLGTGGDQDGGSTAWNNSARSRWAITRPPADAEGADPDARVLSRRKANYAATGASISLRWREGSLLTDGETRHPTAAEPPQDRRAFAEAVFLELLAKCRDFGMHLSLSPHSGNFAPKVFAARPDRRGVTKFEFNRAMQSLIAADRLRLEPYGRKGDERQELVEAEAEAEGGE